MLQAYFRGVTAERFCVRNSGAVAVCEVGLNQEMLVYRLDSSVYIFIMSIIGYYSRFLKTNINNTLRFLRANVSQETFTHGEKHNKNMDRKHYFRKNLFYFALGFTITIFADLSQSVPF